MDHLICCLSSALMAQVANLAWQSSPLIEVNILFFATQTPLCKGYVVIPK